jgi:hypothetical protein
VFKLSAYYANLKQPNRFRITHAWPFFDWSTVPSPTRTINTRQKSAQKMQIFVECLHTLQQRTKWKIDSKNLKIGEIVIIKEDNLPPRIHGRITQIHPENDADVSHDTPRRKFITFSY